MRGLPAEELLVRDALPGLAQAHGRRGEGGDAREETLEVALLDLRDRILVRLEGAVDAYADFHWKHMRREETEVLPLAEKHLTADDWRAIDRAFQANEDPIAQIEERDFQTLFSRIATLAPAPVGLGEPWKRVAN